jgi:hypothetical protein
VALADAAAHDDVMAAGWRASSKRAARSRSRHSGTWVSPRRTLPPRPHSWSSSIGTTMLEGIPAIVEQATLDGLWPGVDSR